MKSVMTALAVAGILAMAGGFTFGADRDRDRGDRRDQGWQNGRGHQQQVSVRGHEAGPYAWSNRTFRGPNTPAVVVPTPVYRGYDYLYARPVYQPVVYRPVTVCEPVTVYQPVVTYQAYPQVYYRAPVTVFTIKFSW